MVGKIHKQIIEEYQPDRISYSYGIKLNIGNYESENVQITMSTDKLESESIDECFKRARAFVLGKSAEFIASKKCDQISQKKLDPKEEISKALDSNDCYVVKAKEFMKKVNEKFTTKDAKVVDNDKIEYSLLIEEITAMLTSVEQPIYGKVIESLTVAGTDTKEIRRIRDKLKNTITKKETLNGK